MLALEVAYDISVAFILCWIWEQLQSDARDA